MLTFMLAVLFDLVWGRWYYGGENGYYLLMVGLSGGGGRLLGLYWDGVREGGLVDV